LSSENLHGFSHAHRLKHDIVVKWEGFSTLGHSLIQPNNSRPQGFPFLIDNDGSISLRSHRYTDNLIPVLRLPSFQGLTGQAAIIPEDSGILLRPTWFLGKIGLKFHLLFANYVPAAVKQYGPNTLGAAIKG
jgi:hypothetical protein